MIKFKVKIKISGTVLYKGKKLKHNQLLNEYDIDLLKLVEQKLINVQRIVIGEDPETIKKDKKKKKKDEEKIIDKDDDKDNLEQLT